MLRVWHGYTTCMFLLVAASVLSSTAYGKGYKDFSLLNPDECVPLEKKVVLQLPAEWHKYADFVKVCGMKPKKDQPAKVSIVSVFADAYYDAQSPNPVWEPFPVPLIVDSAMRQVGQLPEIYPSDPPRYLRVYYGKWQSGVPTEIRVDVQNPAVTGNYYYAPLMWNDKSGLYQMKDGGKETYGTRPK